MDTAPPLSTPPPSLHPSVVLAAYAEELLTGSRVAYFGDSSLTLVDELVARGARVGHVYDPDARRAAEVSARARRRSLYVSPLGDLDDLGMRDGAFDIALVPDLSIFSDPAAVVAMVRRALGPHGVALIASPNRDARNAVLEPGAGTDALGYYDLYDAVAGHFQNVRMLGQTAFFACTVAELSAEGEPDPTIDNSLAGDQAQEPEWFVVLASERPVRLDPYALLELPLDSLRAALRRAEPAVSPSPPAAVEPSAAAALTFADEDEADTLTRGRQAPSRAEEKRPDETLRRERDALAHERDALAAERDSLARQNAALTQQRDELRRERDALARQHESTSLERDALAEARDALRTERDDALERMQEASRRSADERARAERTARELAAARDELKAARARAEELGHELAKDRARREAAEKELDAARHDPERAALAARVEELEHERRAASLLQESNEAEISRLEERLRERGRELARAQGDLKRRERLVRDLLARLDELESTEQAAPAKNGDGGSIARAEADFRDRMDELAAQVARREADLTAASWRIAQLERQLLLSTR